MIILLIIIIVSIFVYRKSIPKNIWKILGITLAILILIALVTYHPEHVFVSCPSGEEDMGNGCVKLQPFNYPFPHYDNGA